MINMSRASFLAFKTSGMYNLLLVLEGGILSTGKRIQIPLKSSSNVPSSSIIPTQNTKNA